MAVKVGVRMKVVSPPLFFAVLIMCICIIAWYFYAEQLNKIDINYVSVNGELSPSQHQEILARLASQALNDVSLSEIKSQLERKLWVSSVSIERDWPDKIHVNVVPEIAIALWNDDALINDKGTIFKSDYVQKSLLAVLYGPRGSEKEVMQKYQQLNATLLKTGRSIDMIRLDSRGAWMFKNDLGITVLLGKDQLMERMQRLGAILEHLALNNQFSGIERIDTRYSNGVAIRWKQVLNNLELAESFKWKREQKL
ncbi:MAG: cell division protein FtsQ/DivIB [Pseudomonadales bacterium]|nr:cell division protein FtsQ/DivIB [Pseudomonadales bacterium]